MVVLVVIVFVVVVLVVVVFVVIVLVVVVFVVVVLVVIVLVVVVFVVVVVVLVVVIVVVFVAYHHFRVVMMMAGNAVVRIEATHRDTDETVAPEPTAADRVRLAVERAVLEDLTHRQFTVVLVVVFVLMVVVVVLLSYPKVRGTRNLVVFRPAAHRIEVPGEIVVAAVERDQAAAGVRDGIALQLEYALEPVVRSKRGDTIGDDVDDSANRSGTVKQTRRPPENLYLFGHERIDAHGMVDADRRDVHGVQPIFHRPHAWTGQPANDRPRSARGEGRSAYAELVGERFAECRTANALERLLSNDRDRLGQLVGGSLAQHARDMHLLQRVDGIGLFVLRRNDTGKNQ